MKVTDLRNNTELISESNGLIIQQVNYSRSISLFTCGSFKVEFDEWELREILSRHFSIINNHTGDKFGVLKDGN